MNRIMLTTMVIASSISADGIGVKTQIDLSAAISTAMSDTSAVVYFDSNAEVQPSGKPGLTGGWDLKSDFISSSNAGEVTLYGKNEISNSEVVYQTQYGWYKNVSNADNDIIGYWFSGIEISVKIDKAAASTDLQLPMLAAKVQLQQSKAQVRARTIGLSGKKIDEAAPKNIFGKPFDIDTYGKLFAAIDAIYQAGDDSSTVFTPAFYRIRNPEYIAEKSSIAEVAALMGISKRRPLKETIKQYKPFDANMQEQVRKIYKKICSPKFLQTIASHKPSENEAAKARQQLLGITEMK